MFNKNFHSKDRVVTIKNKPCIICGKIPSENAHVVPRSRGGDWKTIVPLCRKHHLEQEKSNEDFEKKYKIKLSDYYEGE